VGLRSKGIKQFRRVKTAVGPIVGSLVFILAVVLFLSAIRASLFSDIDEETRIWFEITFLLLAAVLAELLVVYLRQPVVMVLLLVGVIISPNAIDVFWPTIVDIINILLLTITSFQLPLTPPHIVPLEGTVQVFAQLGAIILLFKIGLHSEIKQIFNIRNFVVGLLGVVIPFVAGYYYAVWTGASFAYALFLGAALTATSVGVTVAVLQELGVMQKEYAKIILGAAVIDDILALLALSFVRNIPSSFDAAALLPLITTLAIALLFLIGGIQIGLFVVRKYFNKITEENFSNRTFLVALAFLLMYAYVAEVIGLSAIVGAFIAGVTLNYSKIVHKINELMAPLEMLFTPIFFISLGMFVDITAVGEFWLPILIISVIAVATKFIGGGLAAKFMGVSTKDSMIVGVGLVPRGEIALIIGLYGLTATTASGEPVLTVAQYTVISAMAFITTIIVPVMLQKIIASKKEVRATAWNAGT